MQKADAMVGGGPQSIPVCHRCGVPLSNAIVMDIHCRWYEALAQDISPMPLNPVHRSA